MPRPSRGAFPDPAADAFSPCTPSRKANKLVPELLRQLEAAYGELASEITALREANALLQNGSGKSGHAVANRGLEDKSSPQDVGSAPDGTSEHDSVDEQGADGNHHISEIWEQSLTFSKARVFDGQMSEAVVVHEKPMTAIEMYNGRLKRFISYPGSQKRLAWDITGFFLIFYDLILIPLRVFSPPENAFLSAVDWSVLTYWTVNVIMSVQVGYVLDGITIMSPYKILVNYAKTWFLLDLIVLVPDWLFSLQCVGQNCKEESNSAEGVVKLLRVLRLTKCLRLLRAAKLKRIFQQITDRIDSEYTGIMLNIGKMIILLLMVNHFIASLWFAVGTLGERKTWVKEYHYDAVDWGVKYLVSFHWSITQFTPASKVNVQPQNNVERLFAVLVVIFALVGFSYIVGSITGSLTQLRAIAEDADKQFWQVRRYLRQNDVSPSLGARIQRYLDHAYAKSKKRTDGSQIQIFSFLSAALRSELRLEIALPHLKIHPLFMKLSFTFLPTLQRIAMACISYQSLAPGDVLFFPGESGTHMYILRSGLLKYTISSYPGYEDTVEWVEKREDWIAEPVLWIHKWLHVGRPASMTETEILLVGPGEFGKMVTLTPAAFKLVSLYAQEFVAWLNAQPTPSHDIFQGEVISRDLASFSSLNICGLTTKSSHVKLEFTSDVEVDDLD